MEDLDLSNTDLIFHLNSMPRVCGSLQTTDSTAHAISRLECGFAIEKFKPFVWTASSKSVRPCSERLRINVLESEAGVNKTLFCWLLSRQKLWIWIAFYVLKMFLNELSTKAKICCWSELLTDDLRKFSSCWIFWIWEALCQWNCIMSLRSALLVHWTILEECRLLTEVL
jgi:hypothetical protein